MGTRAAVGPLHVDVGSDHRVLTDGAGLIIGRDPGVGITVDDPRVSRRHLQMSMVAGTWVVEDLNSSNGTFCNGRPIARMEITGPTVLRLGDAALGPEVGLHPEPPAVAGDPEPAGVIHRPTGEITTIGRDPANDIMLEDLMVSRRHAEIHSRAPGIYELVDLDSHNGTFVNGRRAYRVELQVDDLVGIGRHTMVLTPEGLTEFEERRGVAYAAAGLSVRTRKGLVILDGINFALDEASFLGVVGPSGAGKSTLVNALTGQHPANAGSVFYAGRDLYAEFEHLRRLIGFVPQDDILHRELTVRQTLDFAAELRFPPDVGAAERSERVAEVLGELGLSERRDLPVAQLSGGQRKRVSVAVELLTQPSLLILDEPTSGLDPGYERSLMILLRDLARAGRTIIVVTHSVQSLHLCDRVMCLAPGGRMGWFGPPDELTAYFGRQDYQEVFSDLSEVEGQEWKQRFIAHPDYQRYVVEPLSRYQPDPGAPQPSRLPRWAWWRQFSVLTRRYLATLRSDRKTLGFMLGLAVSLSLILLVALPTGEFEHIALPRVRLVSQAPLVILTLVLSVTELGAFNSIREIVKELPLYRRERAVGLSISAYVASKMVVLGVITIIQAVLLTVVAGARQSGPEDAIVLGWPTGELIVIMSLAGLAAMALALAVSASVATAERAMLLLPVILILQMVLASGGVFPDFGSQPGLKQASYFASAQWGFAGVAATADLNELQKVSTLALEFPIVDLTDPAAVGQKLLEAQGGPNRYGHDATAWLGSALALTILTGLCLATTALVLRRHDGG